MGTDHRGLTESSDRGGASTIAAPKPRQRVEQRQAPRIEDDRKNTGSRAKQAATPAPHPASTSAKAVPVASPHVPVTPADHAGVSTISKPVSPASARIESRPAETALEAAPAAVIATVDEVVDTSRTGLLALLAELQTQELDYPKVTADKAGRAQWMSDSLAKLARVVLNKRPKVDALVTDAQARNELIQAIATKVKHDLGKKYDKTPMPKFLQR